MARRSPPKLGASAFEGVRRRTISVTLDDRPRKLGVKQGLQLKMFEEALSGKVRASQTVVGWVKEREAAREMQLGHRFPKLMYECDASNSIDLASELLGIVSKNDADILQLESWCVQAALSRHDDLRLKEKDILEIKLHVRHLDLIEWPEAFVDDE